MLAPALVGSPRLQAHRDYVIKILLNGLSGPLDGKSYPDLMAPLGVTSTDEWVAGVASYVRSAFGNNAGLVTPGGRRPCAQGDGEPKDAVDGAGARGLAAARARLAELEAHSQPWRRGRGRSQHAPRLDLRYAARHRACGSRSNSLSPLS